MGGAAVPAMMGAQAAGGAYSAWAQGQQGKATSAYYDRLAGTARVNAGLVKIAADNNLNEVSAQEGDAETRLHAGVRQIAGAQKAALVRGAGVGSKTAEQIASDTANKASLDEMALRYNADLRRKSISDSATMQQLNLGRQANDYEAAGGNARRSAGINQAATILGSGTSVADTWIRKYGDTNPYR